MPVLHLRASILHGHRSARVSPSNTPAFGTLLLVPCAQPWTSDAHIAGSGGLTGSYSNRESNETPARMRVSESFPLFLPALGVGGKGPGI